VVNTIASKECPAFSVTDSSSPYIQNPRNCDVGLSADSSVDVINCLSLYFIGVRPMSVDSPSCMHTV
jgi:hypothetical protein